jgi:Predicted transcriptional regulators
MSQLDPIDVELGARVRRRREELGVTQANLAQAVGVTFQQVQKYEKGTNRISASRLVAIANCLHTTAGELLGEGDPAAEGMVGAHELLSSWSRISGPDKRQAILALMRTMKAD